MLGAGWAVLSLCTYVVFVMVKCLYLPSSTPAISNHNLHRIYPHGSCLFFLFCYHNQHSAAAYKQRYCSFNILSILYSKKTSIYL